MLLSFNLQRVVVGVSQIADGRKSTELSKWPARLNVPGARSDNLIRINDRLQVSTLRACVGNFEADRSRQGTLHSQIPALVVRSVQTLVDAGHTRIDCLTWVKRWESL